MNTKQYNRNLSYLKQAKSNNYRPKILYIDLLGSYKYVADGILVPLPSFHMKQTPLSTIESKNLNLPTNQAFLPKEHNKKDPDIHGRLDPDIICIDWHGERKCFDEAEIRLGKNETPRGTRGPTALKLKKTDWLPKDHPNNKKSENQAVTCCTRPLAGQQKIKPRGEYASQTYRKGPKILCVYYQGERLCFDTDEQFIPEDDPVKANIDSKIIAVKGVSGNRGQKSPDNRKERMLSTSLNAGQSLRSCRSRELRGGVLSTDCFCLRRNGLQYDCRRTGCQNSPLCSVLPAPVCEPSRVACITHCSNPHAEELSSICKLRPQ